MLDFCMWVAIIGLLVFIALLDIAAIVCVKSLIDDLKKDKNTRMTKEYKEWIKNETGRKNR